MGDQISWWLEVQVKPGRLDEFKALLAEMVESTQSEPGTLIYECSISDDGGTVHGYDRYVDSNAVLSHLATFGEKFAQRFLQAADPTRLVVHGTPSDEVRQALAAFGPSYMSPLVGFAR